MKSNFLTTIVIAGSLATSIADSSQDGSEKTISESEKAKALIAHQDGSEIVSIDQDKQAANAQELIFEQTNPKVIDLLTEVEILMGKTTDQLEDGNTNGDTIAMQTEIIEKIYEAAKEKAQSSPGPSQPGMGAMLEMMGQMMGKKPGQDQDSESNKGGEGATGDSDAANTDNTGKSDKTDGRERRVPRAAGQSGNTLPPEFQKALDGYNKTPQAK